jgi:hypothetical protein
MIILPNSSEQQSAELLPDNLILLGYRGSIAHNMYIPSTDPDSIDDKDIMGVFIAPIEHYIGFGRDEVKEKFIGVWDAVSYDVRKFIRLLTKCNPNVLSLLWLEDDHLIYEHPLGAKLRANKQIFVTKAAYHSFVGYAQGQFKRMTHFNQEVRAEMASLEKNLTDRGIDLNLLNATQQQLDGSPGLAEMIAAYATLKRRYYSGGYMGAKRKELVKRVGYDSKNAAHLIRLLRMGVEFLNDGDLRVSRTDSPELLAIKRGEWPLQQVKQEAERLFKLADEAYLKSPLPPEPEMCRAEALCIEIISDYYGW